MGRLARRLRRRLKSVQNLLGDYQDSVVARPVLREFGAQAHLDGGNGFTFGRPGGSLWVVKPLRRARVALW